MKKYLLLGMALLMGVVLVGCGGRRGGNSNGGDKVQKNVLPSEINMENNKANDAAIDAFYNKALTVNTETTPTEALTPFLAEGYKSSSSVDSKNAEQLLGQLDFFWKLVPDLKWEPQEIMNEGNRYIVRSKATGTPNGDFMGIPTDGTKSFDIMTIDIHTVQDGKIVSSHHVEDWSTAMQQLSPSEGQVEANEGVDGDETMKVVSAFMGAMGEGDMETMISLMDDDMVWENAGDKALPWIGPWNGKDAILNDFMPVFGSNLETTLWETEDTLVNGDTVAMFGRMNGKMTKNNQEIGEFTFALRVKVKDGKIVLWNWLEDSYAFSQAYNANEE